MYTPPYFLLGSWLMREYFYWLILSELLHAPKNIPAFLHDALVRNGLDEDVLTSDLECSTRHSSCPNRMYARMHPSYLWIFLSLMNGQWL